MDPNFERGLTSQTNAVFQSNPNVYDHRREHPWLVGALGDPGAPVWFVAENPSLRQVERARSPDGSAPTAEAQWWASPGDQLFRRMLVTHGFKDGTIASPGGWRCYITNVVKETDYSSEWRHSPRERVRAALERWMPVLAWELANGAPRLIVALGDTVQRHLSYLAERGLGLPEVVTIRSYAYVASRPEGKRGPMHPDRVAEYSQQFEDIARRMQMTETNSSAGRSAAQDSVYRSALTRLRGVLAQCASGRDTELHRIITSRDQVIERFQPSFQPGRVGNLSYDEFRTFLQFENNRHWTGISRNIGSITTDMDRLRDTLRLLVDESVSIRERIDAVLNDDGSARIRRLAKAVVTPILLISYPDRYGVWNNPSEQGMRALGVWPDTGRNTSAGEQYMRVNDVLHRIAGDLGIDLWALDALWWRISNEDLIGGTFIEDDFEEAVQTTEELDASAPLDTRREVAIRTEQGFIRQQLFGSSREAQCAICGNNFPVEFLRAAHVKRRADCTPEEKRDYQQNVLPMCTFGCDELFERGWITVRNGRITKGRPGAITDPVARYLAAIHDRPCMAYYRGSQEYFDWHARTHTGGA